MRRGLASVVGAALLFVAVSSALAAEPAAKDSAPWHLAKISKADRARFDAEVAEPGSEPLKFLRLQLKFNPALAERKMHKFRVVNQRGDTVGELYGHHEDRALLVFEREETWDSLVGLYLDGLGHREPLFGTRPVAPRALQPAPVEPTRPAAPVVEQPAPVSVTRGVPTTQYVPPPTYVPPPYVPPTDVHVPRTATVVPNATTHVVEAPGTTRVIRGPTHVVRLPHRRHTFYDHTRVVRDERGVVVGGTRVIGDGVTEVVGDAVGGGVAVDGVGVGGGVGVADGVGIGGGVGVGGGVGAGVGVGGGGGPGAGVGGGPGPGAGSEEVAGVGLGPWDLDPLAQSVAQTLQGLGGAGTGTGAGTGAGAGGGPGAGVGGTGAGTGTGTGTAGTGTGTGVGPGEGQGTGPGEGQGTGPGEGQGIGPGEGQGMGPGEGPGPGLGEGPGPGEGEVPGPSEGPTPGEGEGPGPEERFGNPAEANGPREAGPREDMGPVEDQGPLPGMTQDGPLPGMGPGGGGGGGGGGAGGPGARTLGPNNVNLAPQFGPRYVNLAPHLLDAPDLRGPEVYYYDPEVYYYNPEMPVYRPGRPGYGRGYGGGGGGGFGGGGGGNYPERAMIPLPPPSEVPVEPAMVLYISCGEESGPGQVFQVNEHGGVLGIVNLPFAATGLALHRQHGLVAAIPRDGGKLMRIDDTGKVSTIMENSETVVHPVDVGLAADSDTVVVADNIGDCLAALTTAGSKPKIYHRFEGQKWDEQQMSVAVTTDKHVLFGTNGDEGIYRFAGDDYSASKGPLLPGRGGVAADPASLKWAATQSPDQICVFEGEELMQKLQLPANKSFHRQGLLSFGLTGAVVVAARDSDKAEDDPWLIQYETEENENKPEIRNLFKWNRARMLDFVVGPRMYWERHDPSSYRSVY